ncbi:MAG: kynureninase [Planctomycetota bacterium]
MENRSDEGYALEMDAADSLRGYRDRFHVPRRKDSREALYFCGNSLGLQPKGAREVVHEILESWAERAVDGHFEGKAPWYPYHEIFRESGARLVGAKPGEVVMMNSLTVNLHLMMVSFYRPTRERFKILVEYPSFPSDTYAIKTQVQYHGLNPKDAIVEIRPRQSEHTIREEDIESTLSRDGERIALVLLAGVNFFTGQVLDIARITQAAKNAGCTVGWDLAHAAGNVPLQLHDWGVDFAVWCNYKYVNSGPGAVAGCFVHEKHGERSDLVRFGGWWGNDPKSRFLMHLQPEFVPFPGAEGWQVSNPPILSLAPVRASLDLFDQAGMEALREKSVRLTGYLEFLIDRLGPSRFEIITPREPSARGCQLSMLVHDRPKELHSALLAQGVVCDFREPNVIRVAPTPLYNTFHEGWTFAEVLSRHARH